MSLQEFRRYKHASGNREDIARRGTLTQFHQRVAFGQTRIYTDKQYIQGIKEFSSRMLSRHRRTTPSFKRSSRRCTYMSFLDRFQKNSIIHAEHFQNHQKDELCCITFCIHQSTVCQVRFLDLQRSSGAFH